MRYAEIMDQPLRIDHPSGSRGHRWEPHVDAPGVLNDQFNPDDPGLLYAGWWR